MNDLPVVEKVRFHPIPSNLLLRMIMSDLQNGHEGYGVSGLERRKEGEGGKGVKEGEELNGFGVIDE